MNRRFWIIDVPVLIAVIGLLMYILGLMPVPRHMGQVDSLNNPVSITGWMDGGLTAADGRVIAVPGITHLPPTSGALSEATKRGVEVAPDGHLTCLVRVYHWCGNDSITADIQRVDLTDMLTYLKIGNFAGPVPSADMLAREVGGSFKADSGWNVSDYIGFKMWQAAKNREAQSTILAP